MTIKTAQSSTLKRSLGNGILLGALSISTMLTFVSTGVITSAFAQRASNGRQLTITPPSLPLSVKTGDRAEGIVGFMNDSSDDLDMEISIFDVIVQDNLGTPEILPGGTIQNNKYSASSLARCYKSSLYC